MQSKSLTFDRLSELLQAPENQEREDAVFSSFTADESLINMLNASFQHYSNSFKGVKSVNALNCRKSALLSQMLLRHKVITFAGMDLSIEQSGQLFKDLIC